jgi:hypothetical protein
LYSNNDDYTNIHTNITMESQSTSLITTGITVKKWSEVVSLSRELMVTCDAINEKGRKCTRKRKENSIYCGKHKDINDHSFDTTVVVTLQIWDDIPYYVDKNGIVFSYAIDHIQMVGYIDPTTQSLVKVDYSQ